MSSLVMTRARPAPSAAHLEQKRKITVFYLQTFYKNVVLYREIFLHWEGLIRDNTKDKSQSCNLRALKSLEGLDLKMADIKGKATLVSNGLSAM